MNTERDKILTKIIGECYHEMCYNGCCKHCGAHNFINYNFSTWEGFGKLLGFMRKQDCWNEFYQMLDYTVIHFELDPSDFADFVIAYLKGR